MTETAAATKTPEAAAPLLEARALTKHFAVRRTGRARGRRGPAPVVHAVEEVSLCLPPAGITAVVGESGSGKSTLARMLARLITPTSGQLLLDGAKVPVVTRGRREYARDVQMVLQDPFSSLNPVHGVRYHLERPLKLHGLNGHGATLEEAMTNLLERVSLTPAEQFLDKYPHELSGGQRQRVAIARALAVKPRVLLADEPVSMLDVSIRLGVLNLLGDLRDRDGLAILYITHDIASARYLADVIIVMYAGQVVESGPAEQVTDPQGYTLKQNPFFWQKSKVHVPEISFPAYNTNANLVPPVASGAIDFAGDYISNIKANYLAKSPDNHTWLDTAPYFSANNVVGLFLNVTRGPLSDPAVRLAISYGINRQQLNQQGETGYEPPVTNSGGLLLPNHKSFLDPSLSNNLPPTGDAAKVTSTLKADGWTMTGGKWTKNGRRSPSRSPTPSRTATTTPTPSSSRTEVPVVPLMNGGAWAQVSTRNYTGWPTAANPYMNPVPNTPYLEVTILHLTPKF
jgi:peptide/nickel transport system ATP-binding protein